MPLTDASLARDVPAATRVVRARTLEPSYQAKAAVLNQAARPSRSSWAGLRSAVRSAVNLALQPDPQVLWAPAALRAGRKLLSEVPHDVVVATAPPFSALLIGARLARAAGLPLVLDYRDEWDISSSYWENRPRDPVSRWVQARMQAKALRRAQLVLATTQRSTIRLAEKCRVGRQRGADAVHLQRVRRRGFRRRTVLGGAPGELSPGLPRHAVGPDGRTPLVEGVARLAAENPEPGEEPGDRLRGPAHRRAVRRPREARRFALSSQAARLRRSRRGGAHDA